MYIDCETPVVKGMSFIRNWHGNPPPRGMKKEVLSSL